MSRFALHHGDCLSILPTLPEASVDSIVTDPPYGLSFMGKEWDHGVPGEPFWREALRVAKPGAFLLAFGGTRTFHRLTCAIEDAGWEVRDCIMWVYGSGFPKSHNVSKAIDREAGLRGPEGVGFTVAGFSHAPDKLLHTAPSSGYIPPNPISEEAIKWQGWGTALKPSWEPIIVARKPLCGTVADNVLRYGTGAMNVGGCRIPALTGQRPCVILVENGGNQLWAQGKTLCNSCAWLVESSAKQGTQVTRENSAESRAEQTTSVRAEIIRVDIGKGDTGCFAGPSKEEPEIDRNGDSSLSIGASGKMKRGQSLQATKSTMSMVTDSTTVLKTCDVCGCSITDPGTSGSMPVSKSATQNTPAAQGSAAPHGRWPSNLIHDGSEEVVGLMPHDAARFFYCAKASKRDRDEGCDGLVAKRLGAGCYGDGIGAAPKVNGEKASPIRNFHPTVKPTDLMRYLCRLVTQPGGTVLDPFTGSGSTGKAAMLEGLNFIGCELSEEYVKIAQARIRAARMPFEEVA